MTEEEVRSVFTLAGINVVKLWKTDNQYQGSSYRTNPDIPPWWLVQTTVGIVVIGWRSRVIEIDWSDTDIYFNDEKPITKDEVTKTNTYVHAYGLTKAVEYLTALRKEFSSVSPYTYRGERPEVKHAIFTMRGLGRQARLKVMREFCQVCGEYKAEHGEMCIE
jgi:hypothetical protein